MVAQLRSAIERAVSGYGKVTSWPADVDGDDFSQGLLISSRNGQLELAVQYEKNAQQAEVSLSPAGSHLGWLPLALAAVVGFAADRTPELLPIFRGLRVMLGATVGLVVGFLLVAAVGAVGLLRTRVDASLEQSVRAAVREVVQARGAHPQS